MTTEERLRELKAQRDQINSEIKKLEDPSVKVGNAVFRKKKNGYMVIMWQTADERGNLHEPTVITGFCYKGMVQELDRLIGDMTDLRGILKERVDNEKDLRPQR